MRGVEVVALCDSDGPKARSLADRFQVRDVYTDIDDLLEFDELDAVVIATPNHLHEPQTLRALAAGVHVFCERPLALSAWGRTHSRRGDPCRAKSRRREQPPVPKRCADAATVPEWWR